MPHRLVRRLALPIVPALLAVLVSAGCASREERLLAAKERAIAYFARDVTRIEAGWSVVFAYLHRRFGVTVKVASGRTLHDATEGVEPPEMFAVSRRLVDPGATVTVNQVAVLPSPIDRISATGIYCDQLPFPDDWVEILSKAARKGAYALTHSVAAAEWTLENRCLREEQLAGLHYEQVHLLERLIEEREVLEGRHAAITDIWIEAVAMLFYSGAGHRVRPEWIDAVLAAQRPDGGWPVHPRAQRSDPHPTALALWVILEVLEPDAPRVSWVAGK